MTAQEFCYWLQGYIEVQRAGDDGLPAGLNSRQMGVISKHLDMVFAHDIDPKAGGPEAQAKLNALHHGGGDSGKTMRC
jgi:hypothetical protein